MMESNELTPGEREMGLLCGLILLVGIILPLTLAALIFVDEKWHVGSRIDEVIDDWRNWREERALRYPDELRASIAAQERFILQIRGDVERLVRNVGTESPEARRLIGREYVQGLEYQHHYEASIREYNRLQAPNMHLLAGESISEQLFFRGLPPWNPFKLNPREQSRGSFFIQ